MKNHYLKTIFFYVFLTFIFSCSSDDNLKQSELNYKVENSIVGKEIAKLKNEDIIFSVSESSINKGVKNLVDPINENNLDYNKSKIIKIDNSYYLRSFSDNGLITTTLLEEENNNGNITLLVAGISCSSDACSSSSSGCIPRDDKKSCTTCFGDCKKTITSIEPEEGF